MVVIPCLGLGLMPNILGPLYHDVCALVSYEKFYTIVEYSIPCTDLFPYSVVVTDGTDYAMSNVWVGMRCLAWTTL